MPVFSSEKLLSGFSHGEDAAVYKIDDKKVLVSTLDFFTPILDDPYEFGAVAAANSLSDVYATGVEAVLAMNIVCFPDELDSSILKEILKGGADKVKEAGALLVGGHSVKDREPKYGLSVIGLGDESEIRTNKGAKEGDVLILTKPIGTGILSTAIKAGLGSDKNKKDIFEVMSYLNRDALMTSKKFTVNASTDITGFGLIGHIKEMMSASETSCEINYGNISIIDQVEEFAKKDVVSGGSKKNRDYYSCFCDYEGLAQYEELILNDAQTSGGLLFSVPESEVNELLLELEKNVKMPVSLIGKVTAKKEKEVYIRR